MHHCDRGDRAHDAFATQAARELYTLHKEVPDDDSDEAACELSPEARKLIWQLTAQTEKTHFDKGKGP